MKRQRTCLVTLLLASLFMILFSLSACGQPSPGAEAAPGLLTVLSISGGKVLVMKPGDTGWVIGEAEMTLGVDYKIKTEAGGHATITFFEGSTIELDGSTEVSLSELSLEGTTSHIGIDQKIGKTVSRVKKLVDSASSYEVETASAVAAVRGTVFYVSVNRSGVTTVGNMEGMVSVLAQGVEVALAEGTRTTVSPGKPPGKPQPDVTSER